MWIEGALPKLGVVKNTAKNGEMQNKHLLTIRNLVISVVKPIRKTNCNGTKAIMMGNWR